MAKKKVKKKQVSSYIVLDYSESEIIDTFDCFEKELKETIARFCEDNEDDDFHIYRLDHKNKIEFTSDLEYKITIP